MAPLQGKRICFISSRSATVVSSTAILMDWANGRLLQQLTQHFPELSIAIFADPEKKTKYDYKIQAAQIYSLPFPFSYFGGIRNFFRFIKVIKKISRENDVIIAQLPFIGFTSLFFIKKPTIFHVCANVITAARNPFKYSGIRLLASRSFAFFMHSCFRALFRRGDTKLIVNGNELGELYKEYKPQIVVSSSVQSSEIIAVDRIKVRDTESIFQLLFIGRPSKEKGFDTLILAFEELLAEGYNISLALIGLTREELESVIDFKIQNEHLKRVTFYGFISWGEEFKRIVMTSHCLAMCSVSEGTPRVLIEARALGCPVIATRIGGITSSVIDKSDGILFTVGKHEELKRAVLSLYNDEDYRQRLACNGLETVKNFTLEKFSHNFIAAIEEIK